MPELLLLCCSRYLAMLKARESEQTTAESEAQTLVPAARAREAQTDALLLEDKECQVLEYIFRLSCMPQSHMKLQGALLTAVLPAFAGNQLGPVRCHGPHWRRRRGGGGGQSRVRLCAWPGGCRRGGLST